MGEWRDIESAPRDGTRVLLFDPRYHCDEARADRIRWRRYQVSKYIRRRDLSVPTIVGLDVWRLAQLPTTGASHTAALVDELRKRWHECLKAPQHSDLAHCREHVRVAILAECRTLRKQKATLSHIRHAKAAVDLVTGESDG